MTIIVKNNKREKLTMAEDKTPKEQVESTAATKIKWDSSKMNSTYANVCNVTSTREEVSLLFGTNQTWARGGNEVIVELSDRVILNPYAAKRLSLLLQNIVTEYEDRFGEIQTGVGQQVPEQTNH